MFRVLLVCCLSLTVVAGCGTGSNTSAASTPTPPGSPTPPSTPPPPTTPPANKSSHVVVVTMENHSYESVVGSPEMPYFNQLLAQYGLADQYYADIHDSLKDLMLITAGQMVVPGDAVHAVYDVDNIVRQLQKDGKTWKVYASKLPSVGYLGYDVGTYWKHHNPISYFSDVQGPLSVNIVPSVPNLKQDAASGALPNYSYITPDYNEDGHSAPLATADAWLSDNIPAILQSPAFKDDGILFIVWDEGDVGPSPPVDIRGGGGRVAVLVIGPHVKPGFKSEVNYIHESLLATTCDALNLTACPGGGSTATPMSDFFQ